MIALSNELKKLYYTIKDDIIVNISSYNTECSKEGVSAITDSSTQILIPYITVTHTITNDDNTTTTTSKNLFLDSIIEIGDKYDTTDNSIKRIQCGTTTEKKLTSIYEDLCKEEIKSQIRRNPGRTYYMFNTVKSSLYIPIFMISGGEYTISGGVNQINFTETYFNTLKKDVAISESKAAAEVVANKYGYKINTLTVKQ